MFNSASQSSARIPLISFVEAMFRKHPSNACQPSHIAPLLSVYRGTVENGDRKIFSIFLLFEEEKGVSAMSFLSRWKPTTVSSSRDLSIGDIIAALDPNMV